MSLPTPSASLAAAGRPHARAALARVIASALAIGAGVGAPADMAGCARRGSSARPRTETRDARASTGQPDAIVQGSMSDARGAGGAFEPRRPAGAADPEAHRRQASALGLAVPADGEGARREDAVTIRLSVEPSKVAHVWWGAKDLGLAPLELRRPRGSGPLDLVVLAPGYLAHHTRVFTDRDDRLSIHLATLAEGPRFFGYRAPEPTAPPPAPKAAIMKAAMTKAPMTKTPTTKALPTKAATTKAPTTKMPTQPTSQPAEEPLLPARMNEEPAAAPPQDADPAPSSP